MNGMNVKCGNLQGNDQAEHAETQTLKEDIENEASKEQVKITVTPVEEPMQSRQTSPFTVRAFDAMREEAWVARYNPVQIRGYLDFKAVGQKEAKKALSVALFLHLLSFHKNGNVEKTHENRVILLIGPSGSGKTLLANSLAQFAQLPCVTIDASQLSADGWKGLNKDDIFRQLYAKKGEGRPDYGIIVLDEFDKLITKVRGTPHEAYTKLDQQSLLGMLDGTPVSEARGTQVYPTGNNLFILTGAFMELEELRKKKRAAHQIGFGSEFQDGTEEEQNIRAELIELGMLPELAGRITTIAFTHALSEDEMYEAVTDSDGSCLQRYQDLLRYIGRDLSYSEEFVRNVIRDGMKNNLGVREIKNHLTELLNEKIYQMFRRREYEIRLREAKDRER